MTDRQCVQATLPAAASIEPRERQSVFSRYHQCRSHRRAPVSGIVRSADVPVLYGLTMDDTPRAFRTVSSVAMSNSYRHSIEPHIFTYRPSIWEHADDPGQPPAGHTRPPDPQGARPRRAARTRRVAPHRADHAKHVRCRTRLALPRPAPPRGRRPPSSRWGASENNRRAKYYKLTAAGRRQLDVETGNWKRIVVAMSFALES